MPHVNDQGSLLERLVNGLELGPELQFDKDIKEQTYLLPIMFDDEGKANALVTIDGKVSQVPIGVVGDQAFWKSKQYYRIMSNNTCVAEEPSSTTYYIELKETKAEELIGQNVDGNFVPAEGSPFKLLGLKGSEGLHPLSLITHDGKVLIRGIYRNAEGSIRTYNNARVTKDEKVRAALQQSIERARSGETPDVKINWDRPATIVDYLNQFVIGQDEAKKTIAVGFSTFMLRRRIGDDQIPKSNMLVIGPTGVGKTYIVNLLAKQAGIPIIETKATGKSGEGYVGESLSRVFDAVRAKTDDPQPYAIVFIDEIDKIAPQYWKSGGGGFGTLQQDELIGWLEEANILGPRDKNGEVKKDPLSTKNILFVGAGAFSGSGEGSSLEEIVLKRLGRDQKQIGFVKQPAATENHEYPLLRVTPQDLIDYGFKPELVGRFTTVAILTSLSVDQKVKILTEAKRSPFTQYRQLLFYKGFELVIHPDVPRLVVEYAPPETGARGLSAVCSDLFTEILFEPVSYASGNKIEVTPTLARELINLYGPAAAK